MIDQPVAVAAPVAGESMETGLVPATGPEPVPYAVSEERVKKLWEEFDEAREFDEAARKDYAFCRSYARGDSGWEVSVNLIGAYIDIMVSFLYARNPDVAAMPAATVGKATQAQAKIFADTLQVVISKGWKDIGLKRAADRCLRGEMTTGIGWLKSGWQEQFQKDPAIIARTRDIQENLARIEALQAEIVGGDVADLDARKEELRAQQAGLEGHVEKLVYRGLFIDFIPSENVQVSLDVQNLIDCKTAKWITHINFMTLDDAKAKFPGFTADEWASVETFYMNKPVDHKTTSKTAATRDIAASEASNFSGSTSGTRAGSSSKFNNFVMHIEMWRGDENLVYDLIRGMKKCAGCAPPNVATTRFYPFFPIGLHEVDGERHPQSLVMRTYKLIDEYNRTRTGKSELRKRIKPKMAFDARAHTPQQIKKITDGTYAEYIPLKPAVEGATLQQSIWQIPHPDIDPALFDLSEVRSELETLWGVQEALSGGIQVAKTATEAEIQQAGTNARTGAMRDRIEEVLSEIAIYHAEIYVQELDLSDVMEIAGEQSVWPEIDVEDLDLMLQVEIAAGTTGKPNTTAQREAWAAEAPVIRESIMTISQLLMSPPQETARCLRELLEETFIRTGDDRVDIERFIPQPGQPVMLIDPATGQPVMAFPAPMPEGGAPGGGGAPMGPLPEQQGPAMGPTELPEPLQS